MKHCKLLAATSIAVMLFTGICGCGNQIKQNDYEKALLGKWAYAHDTGKVEAIFQENGDAKFEGNHYTYTCDEERIHFKSKNSNSLDLRYAQNNNQMYVYIQSTYTRQIEGSDDSIIGVWCCEEKGWTYEFTSNGTFMEDGALTGYYEVDEQAGTVKLIYGELLEDTIFYYQLTDDGLFIEYPWLMMKLQ